MLIMKHFNARLIHRGDNFNVIHLNDERQRLIDLFRNNGYYYARNDFLTFLADTLMHPGYVNLKLVPQHSRSTRVSCSELGFLVSMLQSTFVPFGRAFDPIPQCPERKTSVLVVHRPASSISGVTQPSRSPNTVELSSLIWTYLNKHA